jgi:Domain of unknown function (DUF4351)
MTRTRHDLFAKQHLEALLEPLGTVRSSRKITSETREVDVWFVPNPEAQSTLHSLGVLGKMAKKRCAIEPFRNTVQPLEVYSCMGKLMDLIEELQRQAKREAQSLLENELPWLWGLSPTVSKQTLTGLRAEVEPDWPKGFYFLAPTLRTGLVALHQLPILEETLWLRLMARNGVQRQAISELLALPVNHPMRQVTIEHLVVLQINLNVGQNLDEDEKVLAMNLTPVYEQWRKETLQEGRQEGRQEGIQVGLQQGERSLILRQLSRRVGVMSPEVRSQVEVLPLHRLEALGEALLDFENADDLMDWLLSN